MTTVSAMAKRLSAQALASTRFLLTKIGNKPRPGRAMGYRRPKFTSLKLKS